MWDAFEALVLPRRVTRRLRPTRLFYRVTWQAWSAVARRMRDGGRRETYLSFFGPLSLIVLLGALWLAARLLIGAGKAPALLVTGAIVVSAAVGVPMDYGLPPLKEKPTRSAFLAFKHMTPELFDAGRGVPAHAMGTFAKDGASVMRCYLGDLLKLGETHGLDDVKPGEGRVVRHRGSLVAAYRDENGSLNVVNARCPHLGGAGDLRLQPAAPDGHHPMTAPTRTVRRPPSSKTADHLTFFRGK